MLKRKKKEEDKEKNETKTTIYINTTCFINNTDISQMLKTKADKVLDSVQREYKNKIIFFLKNGHFIFKEAINSI